MNRDIKDCLRRDVVPETEWVLVLPRDRRRRPFLCTFSDDKDYYRYNTKETYPASIAKAKLESCEFIKFNNNEFERYQRLIDDYKNN